MRLTESGECAKGHPRSALRDVREGELAPPVPVTSGLTATGAKDPNLTPKEDAAAKVVGRLIVIVPATFVLVVGLYTGYAAGVQLGQSKASSWLWSIASMIVTGVIVALLAWDRRRKLGR